jgi:hypothetical protein
VCQTGLDEEPELHWQLDKKQAEARNLQACQQVKHTIARTARDCPDVHFLEMQVGSQEGGEGTAGQQPQQAAVHQRAGNECCDHGLIMPDALHTRSAK